MPTTTTTYSFNKPVVGADEDDWGGYLNGNWDSVDDLLDGTTPITGIDINSGTIGGVTIDGDLSFGDNTKAIFGAGSDLQIYHDGSNSIITDQGTGNLKINASSFEVNNFNDTSNILDGNAAGAVKLYHAGQQKLTTTSTGIDVTGQISADGLTVDGDTRINDSEFFIADNSTGTTAKLSMDVDTTNGARIRTTVNGAASIQPLGIYTGSTLRQKYDTNGDISFYEDTGTTAKFFWDASAERLGIGTSSPSVPLEVASSGSSVLQITSGTNTSQSALYFADPDDGNVGLILYDHTSNYMSFRTNGSGEDMRIDSSGNLLVGKTADNWGATGVQVHGYGVVAASRNGHVINANRETTDGDIVRFQKDGTTVGSIGCNSGLHLVIGKDDTGLNFQANEVIAPSNPSTGSTRDNAIDLGGSSARFDDIYATNGTIQTSDRNEKQDIAELSDAEQRVAVAAKGLLRKFRWRDAVEEKGDEARTHFGIIAQDLQAAFAAEGLDAGDYAMFIHSTWTDEETGEERSRMGVRYSELLAFIIAAI